MRADHTAAGNRVSNLDKRHLVFRIERPRPTGNLYLDPRIADSRAVSSAESPSGISVSPDLQKDIAVLAAMQVAASAEELTSAWSKFLAKHHDELVRSHEAARNLVANHDEAGIAAMASAYARNRARGPARKAKR
jgi:hypothetical protein